MIDLAAFGLRRWVLKNQHQTPIMAKFTVVFIAAQEHPQALKQFVNVTRLKYTPQVFASAADFEKAYDATQKYVVVQIATNQEVRESDCINIQAYGEAIWAYKVARDWGFTNSADFAIEWQSLVSLLSSHYKEEEPTPLESSWNSETETEIAEYTSDEYTAYILSVDLLDQGLKNQIEALLQSAQVHKVEFISSPNQINWFTSAYPEQNKILINLTPRPLPIQDYLEHVLLYAHLVSAQELLTGVEGQGYGDKIQQAIIQALHGQAGLSTEISEPYQKLYQAEELVKYPVAGWDEAFGIHTATRPQVPGQTEYADYATANAGQSAANTPNQAPNQVPTQTPTAPNATQPAASNPYQSTSYLHQLGYKTLLAVVGLPQPLVAHTNDQFRNAALQICDEADVGYFDNFHQLAYACQSIPNAVINVVNFSDVEPHPGMGIPYGFVISLAHPDEFFYNNYVYTLCIYLRDLVLAGKFFHTINGKFVNTR